MSFEILKTIPITFHVDPGDVVWIQYLTVEGVLKRYTTPIHDSMDLNSLSIYCNGDDIGVTYGVDRFYGTPS